MHDYTLAQAAGKDFFREAAGGDTDVPHNKVTLPSPVEAVKTLLVVSINPIWLSEYRMPADILKAVSTSPER